MEVVGKIEMAFSGVQKDRKDQEPEVVMDSGSTISLFYEPVMLHGIKKVGTKLMMETNAGTTEIIQKGDKPAYGEV